MFYKKLGSALREARKSAGLSQSEVAARIGLTNQNVSSWELGKSKIDMNQLLELCDMYGANYLDILSFDTSSHVTSFDPEISSVLHRLNQTGRDAWMKYGRYLADQPEYAAPAQPEEPVLNLPKATRRRDGFTEIRVFDQPAAAGLGNYLDEPAFHVEQFPPGFIPAGADFGIRISGNSMEPEIPDGITVFVRSAPSIDPGRIGIFVLNGEAYCKKLIVDKTQRQIRLVSLNPAYQDIIVSESDVCRTVGQVIGKMM